MLILAIRTDNPTAELYVYRDAQQLAAKQWQGHRELGTTLHRSLQVVLQSAQVTADRITGIVAFKGPGSFTGLRIGLSVANALSYSNGCPIVATQGQDWITDGIALLQAGKDHVAAVPHYDAPVFTTKPRK